MQDKPRKELLGAENERPVVQRAGVEVGRVSHLELPRALRGRTEQRSDVAIWGVAG